MAVEPDDEAAIIAEARRQYPEVRVTDAAFTGWCRVQRGELSQDHVGDMLVAYGCAVADPGALAVFERDFMPPLAEVIRNSGLLPVDADDIRQRVRERLLVQTPDRAARIDSYRGDGPLRGWLRVVAVREALSARRKRRPEQPVDDTEIVDLFGIDPELEVVKANASAEFRTAFLTSLAELPDRDKNILRYTALDGLNGDEVAKIYRVDRSTVSRWLAKARHRLLQGTRQRLTIRLGIDRRQFESLMKLISSRLDVSLSGALDEP